MRAIGIGLLTVMVVALFCACPKQGGGQGAGGGGFQMPPTAVILAPVQQVDYAPAIELVGEVRATQRAMLSAEVGGRVTRIAHRVGEEHRVSDGALVQINPADYRAVLDTARAGLAQAEEGLRLAQNGPREEDISAQQAAVDAARAQYDQALDNLGRQEDLYEQGVISEAMLIAAKTQATASQAALDAQHEVLKSMQAGTRPEQVAQAEAMVAAAASQVRQAELALDKTSVRLAFDAKVAGLLVEVGSIVGPGSPVAEVVSTGPGEAWFNLPEDQVSQVDPGDLVELTFDAMPDLKVMGTVIAVSSAADQMTRQFPLRVAINDVRPLPGMVVYGRLLKGDPRPTMMISRDAVVLDKLGPVVYMMVPPEEGADPPLPTVMPVYVELGDVYGELVVATGDGLQPGTMIVTRGNEQLYMGAKIMPANMGQGAMGGAPGGPGGPPEGAMDGAGGAGAPDGMGGGAGGEEPPAETGGGE